MVLGGRVTGASAQQWRESYASTERKVLGLLSVAELELVLRWIAESGIVAPDESRTCKPLSQVATIARSRSAVDYPA